MHSETRMARTMAAVVDGDKGGGRRIRRGRRSGSGSDSGSGKGSGSGSWAGAGTAGQGQGQLGEEDTPSHRKTGEGGS